MIKKLLKYLFFLPLLAVSFYACHSYWFENELPLEIRIAKEWFETKTGDIHLAWQVGEENAKFLPDWRNAIVGADGNFRIIELPLQGSEGFVQISSENAKRALETGDERYLTTIMRLLVRICRETGEKDGFIMTASPDLENLSRNLVNPMRNFTYLNHGENFSGLVFFYNLTGEFVTGYIATGGEFFRFTPQAMADEHPQLRAATCLVICVTTTTEQYRWTLSGTNFMTEPMPPIVTTECHIVSCIADREGGIGDGGSPGGGNPDNNTDPCSQGATGRSQNNAMLSNATVRSRMHNVMQSKVGQLNEWAVSIGRSGNTFIVSDPREGGLGNVSPPPNPGGSFVATAHTHGMGSATPSGSDVFAFLEQVRSTPTMETMFIYGQSLGMPETFAINVHDRNAVLNFLDNFPRSQNLLGGNFSGAIGDAFREAIFLFNSTLHNINNHGGHYFRSEAAAIAHVMNQFNMGITLSRSLNSGSFQTVNVQIGGNAAATMNVNVCP